MNLTFPVNDCEVRVGGTYAEDKLVSDEGLVCVNSTYRLNQLQRNRAQDKTDTQAKPFSVLFDYIQNISVCYLGSSN